MLFKLPDTFKPSEKYKIGIKNCADILNQTPKSTYQRIDHEINYIGYNAGLVDYVRNLSPEDTMMFATAALATIYTQIELMEG